MAQSYSVEAVLSAQDNMSNVFRNAASNASSMSSAISNAASGINVKMAAAGAAITAFGASSVKDFASFENSLNKAAVVAGGTSKDIDGLGDVAIQMSNSLGISAQECSNAFMSMARDGASVGDIKKEFPAIAQAATASGEDISSVAGVVQNAMNVWGKSIESPQRAAAVLVQTANQSNASIESMQQGLANMAPVASQAGVSLQDTSTALGLLTNKGFSTAQASQDLSHAILQMVAPSSTAAAKAKELGISFVDASGKMKPLPSILQELTEKTANMGDAQKTAALKTMFGTAGYQAIAPLMEAMADKTGDAKTSWDAFSKSVDEASSSTAVATKFLQSQASEMTQNLGAKLNILKQSWTNFGMVAQQSNNKAAMSMVDFASKALQWATTSKSSAASVIRSVAGLSPVIGPAMTMASGFFSKFNTIVTGTKTVVGGVKSVVSAATAPFRALGASAGAAGNQAQDSSSKTAALGTAAQEAGAKATGGSTGLNSMGASAATLMERAGATAIKVLSIGTAALEIGAGIGVATVGIAALVNSIANLAATGQQGITAMETFGVTVAGLAAVFALLGPALDASSVGLIAFGAAVGGVGVGIGAATAGIAALITALTSFNGTGAQVVTVLGSIGAGFAAMVAQFIVGITTAIPQVIQGFAQMMVQSVAILATYAPQFMYNGIMLVTNLMNGVAQGAPQLIAAFFNMLNSIIVSITSQLPTFMANGAQMIVALLQGIAQQIPMVVPAAMNVVTTFLTTLAANLPQMISAGMQVIIAFLQGVAQNIAQVVAAALNVIAQFLSGIAQGLPGVINKAVDVIVAFITGIGDNLGRIIQAGVDLIFKFIDGLIEQIPRIADKAVEAVMQFVYGVGYTLGRVISSGGQLIENFIKGIMDGINGTREAGSKNGHAAGKGADSQGGFLQSVGSHIMSLLKQGISSLWGDIVGAARDIIQDVCDTVGSIGNNLGTIGHNIMVSLGQGIQDVAGDIWGVVNNIVDGIVQGVQNCDLTQAGVNIMQSFYHGLKSIWGDIQDFVGSIGSWIQDHKGPVSYDKKLLIPAGKAIMNGLQGGLEAGFSGVKNTINGITSDIARTTIPNMDSSEFTNSLDRLYATNNSLNGGTLGIDNKYRLSMEQQPAYINLTMGDHNWGTFVDDISTKQGSQAVLQNNYRI